MTPVVTFGKFYGEGREHTKMHAWPRLGDPTSTETATEFISLSDHTRVVTSALLPSKRNAMTKTSG